MPISESALRYQFGDKVVPQYQYAYDALGRPTYTGAAMPGIVTSLPGWLVTKSLYTGSDMIPYHESTLANVIWDLRDIYNFP